MIKITLLIFSIFLLIVISSAQPLRKVAHASTPGVLTITATESTAGGSYKPKHCTAIWIQDASGKFVKTLLAYAASRKTHLNNWESATSSFGSTYNTVDAISGATKNSFATINCKWDGTNIASPRAVMPDGTYTIKMELTDKNNTGNLATFTFTKGPNSVVLTPANQPSFSNVTLSWAPATATVTGVSITPNPTSVVINKSIALTPNVTPIDAANKNVSWVSSNTSIATVNASGVVSGVAEGKATITVTTVDQLKTATCEVTVLPASSIGQITYTGTAYKADGWVFTNDNSENFFVDNIIEAWQYDKGNYMPIPNDLSATTANIAAFQNGDFAAGLIKAPATTAPDLNSCEVSKNIWDASNGIVQPAIRKKYLNRRKGDSTSKYATSCPALVAGTEVLGVGDPASYPDAINVSAFTMHDSFGRLSNGGSALRYSVTIEPGQYNLIFKGNSNIARMRLLKRSAENLLTEVYNGTVSGLAATTMSQKVAASTGSTYGPAAPGYDGLIEHLQFYGTGTCAFSTQMDNRAELTDKTKLLTLELDGDYVVELITEGNGAVGAFTFSYAGAATKLNKVNINKTSVCLTENNFIVKLNGFGASTVKIYNTTGVLVSQKHVNSNETRIAASNFVKGVYLVKIDNEKNSELHKLIVK